MLMCAFCRDKRDKDAKSKLDLLGQIEAAERTLQQTSRDKVDSAVAEFDTVVCEADSFVITWYLLLMWFCCLIYIWHPLYYVLQYIQYVADREPVLRTHHAETLAYNTRWMHYIVASK